MKFLLARQKNLFYSNVTCLINEQIIIQKVENSPLTLHSGAVSLTMEMLLTVKGKYVQKTKV